MTLFQGKKLIQRSKIKLFFFFTPSSPSPSPATPARNVYEPFASCSSSSSAALSLWISLLFFFASNKISRVIKFASRETAFSSTSASPDGLSLTEQQICSKVLHGVLSSSKVVVHKTFPKNGRLMQMRLRREVKQRRICLNHSHHNFLYHRFHLPWDRVEGGILHQMIQSHILSNLIIRSDDETKNVMTKKKKANPCSPVSSAVYYFLFISTDYEWDDKSVYPSLFSSYPCLVFSISLQ